MKREDDQELWDILGHAAEPELSPFFARNALRRIRQKSGRFEWTRKWFSLRRVIPATALAIAVIGTIIATHHPVLQQSPESESDVVAKIDPQDYEVVADLDELLVLDENNLWDGKPTL